MKRKASMIALTVGLVLGLAVLARAETPAPWTRGRCVPAEGQAMSIQWKTQNVKAMETGGALRLEVEPKLSGTAGSLPLALLPLHAYTLTMTCRRGPGLGLNVWVKWLDAAGNPGMRQMVWQLSDGFRPNWWPLSAHKNTYTQRFCLPPGATQVTLEIAMTGHPDAGYNFFELYDLVLAGGAAVPFGPHLGPNLCLAGAMESAGADGMALGWGFWGPRPDAKLLDKDSQGRTAHGGRRFLAFPAGKNCILAGGSIPVQQGRAYRLSFWARGTAELGVGAHSLEARQGQRVGDPQQVTFRVDARDWQQFSFVWFAEALYTSDANLFIGINTRTELHLDDVTFQRIEP
jgi:hypothetical protein